MLCPHCPISVLIVMLQLYRIMWWTPWLQPRAYRAVKGSKLQLKYLLMIFRLMYKGGYDVKSGKRCLYCYYVCYILLVMYSWF